MYLCAPSPHPVDAVTVKGCTLLPPLLIYILACIYITFINYIVLFLNILLRNDTLFTYAIRNILLIIGIIFGVFHGPDGHLQVLECPFAGWSVVRYHLCSQHHGGCILLTTNKITQLKPDSTR